MRNDINKYFFILERLSRKTFFKSSNDSSFIALIYHRIANTANSNDPISMVINASVSKFDEEVNFLKRDFNIISAEEAVNALINKTVLPERGLLITFDDGYKDNYTNAFPVLKKYKVPATIFLTTDSIDNYKDFIWKDKVAYLINKAQKSFMTIPGLATYNLMSVRKKNRAKISIIQYLEYRGDLEKNRVIDSLCEDLKVDLKNKSPKGLYLSSEEILEMSRAGISFGSHSCSHPILSNISPGQAQDEIIKSKAKIEQIVGEKVDFFAYPNGTKRDFNDRIIEILKDSGYKAAFTCIAGRNRQAADVDLFSLRRIPAGKSLWDLKKNILLYT
jgi:peptidoglycan/xylan/chitin deacetylase (PgdA/CDA1 family)